MTREEAKRFWKIRYENAKDFSDPNWDAQERREHREYVEALRMAIEALSGQTEIIYCKECVYYDPPHIEDKGKRLEYKDMPKDAFDKLGTGLVHSGYGINVGGRCIRDYNAGYVEDKRVFVGEENYCGRAIKGGEQSE